MSKKDELRQKAARKRLRLPLLLTMLQPSLDSWEYGIKGGETVTLDKHSYTYAALDVPEKEKRVIRMMLGKIKKAQTDAIKEIGPEVFTKLPKKFYDDADERIVMVEQATVKVCPDDTDLATYQRVITYVIYSVLLDYYISTNERRPGMMRLLSCLSGLCNYLIPPASPLITPINEVYWDIWDNIMDGEAHPVYTELSEEEKRREKERS